MGYLPPTTIADILRRIQKRDLILPAIQREYVWRPKQVRGLFDSIMRGYPIGGFLSWKVESDIVNKFRFYGFLKDYNEFNSRHNPAADPVSGQAITAILDGQQRLTSLNIGLRGSFAYRKARAWSNNPDNYPVRRLYLNVLDEAEENESGWRYDFRFLTAEDLTVTEPEVARHWFPVSQVFDTDDLGDLWDVAGDAGLANNKLARNMLSRLWKAVHGAQSLYFYEEVEQDVERVLDIFIRVNSAGTVLSYSDLLLSIATAQWKERDARDAIHGLVDTLNSTGQGFSFNQDNVLKSGLMLADIGDVGFKVKNFTSANMTTLDQQWDKISDSLKVAVGLLGDFGLSSGTLSANSALIPIAYYVHRRGLTQSYRESYADAADRAVLRSWTLRSLIMPGVWGSGLDTLLRDLRHAIAEHGRQGFPSVEIEKRMAVRGKSLAVTPDQVEDILKLTYGSPRTFAVLAMLFPHVNTRNIHHIDHIFPQSLLAKPKLKQAGFDSTVIEHLQAVRDQLPNLQLLEGLENISKSATMPANWAASQFNSQQLYDAYRDRNQIPWLPTSVLEFEPFFAARRKLLAKHISTALAGLTFDAVDKSESESLLHASIDFDLAEATFDN